MTGRTLLLTVLLLTCSLSGCFGEEEEDTGFQWQEKVEIPCDAELVEGLACKEYLTGFVTPVASIHHPQENEIWIADLSGIISAWDGENLRTVANLSEFVSN